MLVERTRAGVRRGLPSYAVVSDESIRSSIELNLDAARTALLDHETPPTRADDKGLEQRLKERIGSGLPIHDVMQGYRTSIAVIHERLVETASIHEVSAGEMLGAARALWRLGDAMTARTAALYHRLGFDAALHESHLRSDFLRELLSGTLPEAELESRSSAFGLDPGTSYRAIKATPGETDGLEPLRRRLEDGVVGAPRGVVGVSGAHCLGLVPGIPPGELRDIVAVGPSVRLRDVPASFDVATRLHEWMERRGARGPRRLEDVTWRLAVDREELVTDVLAARYHSPLEEHGAFGSLVWESVRTYLGEHRNVARAAARLVVHQNTLRYRLAKYSEITGVDLESTDTLVELTWVITARVTDQP